MNAARSGCLILLVTGSTCGGCASLRRQPAPFAVATSAPWSDGPFVGRRFVTPHFELISTINDAPFEAALPKFLETVHSRHRATITPTHEPTSRMTTYLFGSRSEWMRFAKAQYSGRVDVYARIRTGGFTENGTAVAFHMGRATTLATLAHEAWHQYVDTQVDGTLPAWLNEGLACYHEAIDYSGASPRFTPMHNTFRSNSLRDAIRLGRLIPLSELIRTDAGRLLATRDTRLESYYAEVWALVTMLRHGAGGRYAKAFDRMLREIGDGAFAARVGAERLTQRIAPGDDDADAVLRVYFGKTADQLETDFEKHVMSLTGL